MSDTRYLDWPSFEERHRRLATELETWAAAHVPHGHGTRRCRSSAGLGVVSGQVVKRLYREIRSLRIYEGASEVQQLIIARELLKEEPSQEPK
jgi:alkylation response protein AidB-like acyl-CoA dehydrogenase